MGCPAWQPAIPFLDWDKMTEAQREAYRKAALKYPMPRMGPMPAPKTSGPDDELIGLAIGLVLGSG